MNINVAHNRDCSVEASDQASNDHLASTKRSRTKPRNGNSVTGTRVMARLSAPRNRKKRWRWTFSCTGGSSCSNWRRIGNPWSNVLSMLLVDLWPCPGSSARAESSCPTKKQFNWVHMLIWGKCLFLFRQPMYLSGCVCVCVSALSCAWEWKPTHTHKPAYITSHSYKYA